MACTDGMSGDDLAIETQELEEFRGFLGRPPRAGAWGSSARGDVGDGLEEVGRVLVRKKSAGCWSVRSRPGAGP
jgi:hypothetical protein